MAGEHDRPVHALEEAADVRLDYGTLTPLIKRLETHGLLKRQRRADDERVVEVALTPEGPRCAGASATSRSRSGTRWA
ncbi:MarR family transcriptional regulator [Streptomyces sp. NBC_01619]|uniref:transcriptional regulator, SarA/Rot family n=1 Tax=Streptomyces sp. NBC_01619 TaxID=2975901 RepID=UPI00338FC24C